MKKKENVRSIIAVLAVVICFIGSYIYKNFNGAPDQDAIFVGTQENAEYGSIDNVSVNTDVNTSFNNSIPEYAGEPYIILNNNVPLFEEYSLEEYELYSPLDDLGRCGVAEANICPNLMPTEERGEIGMIKPAGWHTVKYDCVDGKYLYNRCHLIGFQLAGENANEKNLITGTRYLNVVGMLPFENEIADYVHKTGSHVMYRVTPVYNGGNLLCDGVIMEALSVEDKGEGVCFSVFCYNVQPGVVIDYSTGESWAG